MTLCFPAIQRPLPALRVFAKPEEPALNGSSIPRWLGETENLDVCLARTAADLCNAQSLGALAG